MVNQLNKVFSDIFEKVDEKVLQAKLNTALDMLKKGDTDELAKKINKMDKDELLEKINEFDVSKLEGMNIDKNEIKQQMNQINLDSVAELIGEHGDEIIKKIKNFIG